MKSNETIAGLDINNSIIVFSNAQTNEAEIGIQALIEKLKQQYIP